MKTITAEELKKRMENSEDINLVDVREPAEREEFHIGGEFLPLGNIMSMQIDPIEDLKEKEVICYCRSGIRSTQACMMLETLGFKNVYNLVGGTKEWQSKFNS